MLNRALFTALQRLYEAEVVNEDDRGDFKRTVTTKDSGRVYVDYVTQAGGSYGERYRMDCPFCSDTKRRFYVGYLFGKRDAESGQTIYHACKCFNEDCQSDFDNLRNLLEDVELAATGQIGAEAIDFGNEETPLRAMGEIAMPGYCIPLREITPGSPYWPAIEYIEEERKFDWQILESHYGVQLLIKSHTYRALNNRLWTPFYRDGMLIAWTARAVPALCDSEVRHWHSKGGLGGLLYGLRGALDCRVLCIVEGPADKWRTGRPGVAILSKKLGAQKLQRLMAGLLGSSVELVVVLLDPTQPESERHLPHQIDAAVELLRRYCHLPVVPVYLPDGKDPGATYSDKLASYLRNVLTLHGYSELGTVLARDVSSSTAARRGY